MTKKSKLKEPDGKMLTDAELELMTILWAQGEGSVAEVMEGLPPSRDLAYTTVSTILRILEQKGVVKTRKEGRGHIYIPRLTKEAYETKTLKHVVQRVFNDTPVALVRQLLKTVQLDEKELKDLKALIKQAEDEK